MLDKSKANNSYQFDAKFHLVYIHTPDEFKFTKEGLAQISNFIWNFILKNFLREIYNSLMEEAGILEFASDIGTDLIATTTLGRIDSHHHPSGSLAEDVVNQKNRPIWPLKTPEADRQ